MAGILGLFAVIPRIDPLRENIAEFRSYYDWFVVIFTIYMFVVHAGVVAFNLGYEFDFTYLILVAAAGLFYYSGVVLTHAKQNWFVGIRTPWTLSSAGSLGTNPRARRPPLQTHRHPSRSSALLFGNYALYFLLVPALLTAGGTIVYSYYLYERLDRTSRLPQGRICKSLPPSTHSFAAYSLCILHATSARSGDSNKAPSSICFVAAAVFRVGMGEPRRRLVIR